MKTFKSPALRTWFNWGVTAVTLTLLFYWVPLREAWDSLRASDPTLLVAAALLTLINILCRGVRWQLITGAGTGRREQVIDATKICAFALAMNALLPAKAGEIARIALMKQRLGLSLGRATSAALVEKLFDSIVLLLLTAAALAYTDFTTSGVETKWAIQSLLLVSALVLTSALLLGNPQANRAARRLLANLLNVVGARRFVLPVLRFVAEMGRGMRRLASRDMLVVLAITIGIWMLLGAGVYLTGRAAPGIDLSPAAALAFATITVLVTAVPSAPGGWGVFEAAGVVLVLMIADNPVTTADAASFTLAAHLVQYLPVVASGSVAWLLLRNPLPAHGR